MFAPGIRWHQPEGPKGWPFGASPASALPYGCSAVDLDERGPAVTSASNQLADYLW